MSDHLENANDIAQIAITLAKKVQENVDLIRTETTLPQFMIKPKQICDCLCKVSFTVPLLQKLSNSHLHSFLEKVNIESSAPENWNEDNRNSAIVTLSQRSFDCKCTKLDPNCDCGARIVHQGIDHHPENPVKKSVKTGLVKCYHIDYKRDLEVGLNLSQYNHNYVFQKPPKGHLKYNEVCAHELKATVVLPPLCDQSGYMGPVYDQGQLGSCTSNSCANALRQLYGKKEGLGLFLPSRLFIYYNGRVLANAPIDQDTGLSITGAYESVQSYGVAPENTDWPYDISKFTLKPNSKSYSDALNHKNLKIVHLDSNAIQIKTSICQGYLVSFGATLYESFETAQTAKTGVIPSPNVNTEKVIGGHAMLIVAYFDSYKNLDGSLGAFKVCNSWSSSWGNKGYCMFPYNYLLNPNLCNDFVSPRIFT